MKMDVCRIFLFDSYGDYLSVNSKPKSIKTKMSLLRKEFKEELCTTVCNILDNIVELVRDSESELFKGNITLDALKSILDSFKQEESKTKDELMQEIIKGLNSTYEEIFRSAVECSNDKGYISTVTVSRIIIIFKSRLKKNLIGEMVSD